MSYMSSDALTTRIKAISSGKGEQSKIKMLTFYYALQAGNLLSLAAYSLEMIEKMDQNLYFELTNGLQLPPERTDYCSIEIKDENNLDVKDSKLNGSIQNDGIEVIHDSTGYDLTKNDEQKNRISNSLLDFKSVVDISTGE